MTFPHLPRVTARRAGPFSAFDQEIFTMPSSNAKSAATATDPGITEPITTKVLIIGSGFSGLGMAVQLRRRGYSDFIVLEKADSVGGTWRDNTYPGCACDVPSLMYSYSFESRGSWSKEIG